MKLNPITLGALGALGALVTTTLVAFDHAESEDEAGVRRAVLDYVEAVEQGKPELIERSVSKELSKFGFSQSPPSTAWRHHPMTFDGLYELAGEMKDLGYVPDDPQHEVILLDVMDKIASIKLTAFWGIDYMHLVKYDGKWMIVQVLWQTSPMDASASDPGK